jgi:hypothetical protein
MGRTKVIQHSLNAGILSPTAFGRVDISKYYSSVKDGLNTVCHPHGGQFKRNGFKYIATLAGDGRLIKFSFNIAQSYVLVFTNNNIAVYQDDVFVQNVVTTYTLAQVKEIGFAQSADTMIITHYDHQPAALVRNSGTGVWSISNITLTGIPTYDFGSGAEAVISVTRGWPRVCTFYESRLWFAGLKSRPQTILGSKTNDFYNLSLGTGLADEGIYDTLDTDQINPIVNIFPGRQLQVFTEGGEFSNTAKPITPADSSWTRHTNYGSKEDIRPVILDGATMFMDRSGRNLREFVFSFAEDAYTATSASTLAYDIINQPLDVTVVGGTKDDISNLVLLVNNDGSIAVFNTLRVEEVAGWTRWTTQGEFKSIEAVYDDLYAIVSRDNGYFLEKQVLDVYVDSHVTEGAGGPTITGLSHLDGQEVQIVADNSVMIPQTVASGEVTTERTYNAVEVGLGYNSEVELLPISPNLGGGSSVNREKRILKATLRVHETRELKFNDQIISFRQFDVDKFDETPTNFTGIKEIRQLGYGRLQSYTIKSDTPTPFKLLAVEQEVTTK